MTEGSAHLLRIACFIVALASLTGCSALTSSQSADPSPLPSVTSPPTTATSTTSVPEATVAATSSTTAAPDAVTPLLGNYTVEVVAALPHDPSAYTQGLEWYDGRLYESTGQYGASDRRRLDPATGDVELLVPLDDAVFAEGLTIVDDELLQLTWREGELERSGLDDLETRSTQSYAGEGWGLCHDGNLLIMSDGSSTLTRRDPATFAAVSTLEVTADGDPVERLNELECVGDQVFANVYGLDQVAVIDGTSGIVVAVIEMSKLRPEGLSPDDYDYVLNGIAFQPETGHWFVTGKYWPVLYEVTFVPL